mgnify:CR=1 FL=1
MINPGDPEENESKASQDPSKDDDHHAGAEEHLFDGEWYTEKRDATKSVIKRQIVRPGEDHRGPHAAALSDDRLSAAEVDFVIEPTIRFAGQPGEQATMFFLDPSGNALEIKAMADPALLPIGLLRDRTDLAALVIAAVRADLMRELAFVALRAFAHRLRRQGIVRAALGRARLGVSTFWIRHG